MLERIRFTRSPGVYSLLYSMFFVVIFPLRSYNRGEIELGYSALPLPVQTRAVHAAAADGSWEHPPGCRFEAFSI